MMTIREEDEAFVEYVVQVVEKLCKDLGRGLAHDSRAVENRGVIKDANKDENYLDNDSHEAQNAVILY